MCKHLAVEQHVVTDLWRALGQLRKRAGRVLQVPRKEFNAAGLAVELAADSVVLLLSPNGVRAHALECFAGCLDRAGEHETHWLEKGDRGHVELTVLAPHRGLTDVAGDEVDAFHHRDRDAESLGDRGFDQAFA